MGKITRNMDIKSFFPFKEALLPSLQPGQSAIPTQFVPTAAYLILWQDPVATVREFGMGSSDIPCSTCYVTYRVPNYRSSCIGDFDTRVRGIRVHSK